MLIELSDNALALPTDEQVRRYTATAHRYDQIADDFRDQSLEAAPLVQPRIERMLSYAPAGGRILDAGCGAGVYTNFIASRGYRTVGVDISERQISLARSMTSNPLIEYRQANLVEMKMKKGEFDGMIFIMALQHILKQDRKTLLTKMGNGLKDAGRMFFVARTHPISKEDFVQEMDHGKRLGRIASRSTLEELVNLITDCGLAVDKYLYAEPHPDASRMLHHLLLRKRYSFEHRLQVSDLVLEK